MVKQNSVGMCTYDRMHESAAPQELCIQCPVPMSSPMEDRWYDGAVSTAPLVDTQSAVGQESMIETQSAVKLNST